LFNLRLYLPILRGKNESMIVGSHLEMKGFGWVFAEEEAL
jgi:hypothetical protein